MCDEVQQCQDSDLVGEPYDMGEQKWMDVDHDLLVSTALTGDEIA